MDILAAYREAGSYRSAAAMCGTTHKTVRRLVEAHEASCAGLTGPQRRDRGHSYDDVRGLVAERVRKSQGRISAKRLLPAARAAGYAGSVRNFRRLVADVKSARRAGHHRGRRPAVWTPGDTLVIDWGSARQLTSPPSTRARAGPCSALTAECMAATRGDLQAACST